MTTTKTLSQRMLDTVDGWKDGYFEIIRREDEKGERGENTDFEYGQYKRLTAVQMYLEERVTR